MAHRIRREPSQHGLDAQIEFVELTISIFSTPMNHALLSSLKELRGIKQNRVMELKRESNRF